ncbi:prephenate dehydrogenase [uncultured Corynebacterium sp.]|uniref:prephenate dehydrogenase n=1 Tax=uncultured Corynebacterium sp. TaxID=159447 RepID=UPI002597EFCE|nr:prephenate dehydrogenase [uncultured Corynebacterium sp.]
MSNFESPSPASSSLSAARLPAVCILGLGLIGGSMMRDLRAHNVECFGWNRSSPTVEEATKEGFDASTDLQATLERAEASRALIVIGTPMTVVGTMLDTINEHAPSCGITDVVSVKAAVAAEVSARGMEERFVGAHPMAGSAQAGWSATLEGLFDGAPWVITYDLAAAADSAGRPVPERWIEVFSQVANLGAALGSQLIPALSNHHDASVARISHMPHLAAYAIAAAGEAGGPLAISLAAGSFRDCTRVAAAAPDMVMSWCENNTEPVLAALDDVIERLTAARTQLATEGTAMDLAKTGQIARVRYEARPAHRPIFRLRVGEGDWINQLKLAESVGGQVDVF